MGKAVGGRGGGTRPNRLKGELIPVRERGTCFFFKHPKGWTRGRVSSPKKGGEGPGFLLNRRRSLEKSLVFKEGESSPNSGDGAAKGKEDGRRAPEKKKRVGGGKRSWGKKGSPGWEKKGTIRPDRGTPWRGGGGLHRVGGLLLKGRKKRPRENLKDRRGRSCQREKPFPPLPGGEERLRRRGKKKIPGRKKPVLSLKSPSLRWERVKRSIVTGGNRKETKRREKSSSIIRGQPSNTRRGKKKGRSPCGRGGRGGGGKAFPDPKKKGKIYHCSKKKREVRHQFRGPRENTAKGERSEAPGKKGSVFAPPKKKRREPGQRTGKGEERAGDLLRDFLAHFAEGMIWRVKRRLGGDNPTAGKLQSLSAERKKVEELCRNAQVQKGEARKKKSVWGGLARCGEGRNGGLGERKEQRRRIERMGSQEWDRGRRESRCGNGE